MRILHLLSDSRFTGPAQPVLQLVMELRRRGHDAQIGCNRRPPTWRISKKLHGEGHFLFLARRLKVEPVGDFEREIRNVQVPLVEQLDLNRYFNIRDNIRSLFALRDLQRGEKYDIIHLHLPHDHWIGAVAKWIFRSDANLVATIHKVEKPHSGLFHKLLYTRMIDRIAVVSERSRQMVLRHLRVHSRNVRTIWGAVDVEKFHPGITGEKIRAELGIQPDALVIGMVARFQPHRQHAILVRAADRVLERFPHARFLLSGRGEYKEEIEKLVYQRGLEQKVLFAGYRKEDYPETIAATDLLFFSVPGSDGTCRAVLETMALGKPVVAFDTGVLPETIEDEHTGWITPTGDQLALEETLMKALRNPDQIRRMGEAARETVCRRHTVSGQADIIEEFYSDLLEEKALAAGTRLARRAGSMPQA